MDKFISTFLAKKLLNVYVIISSLFIFSCELRSFTLFHPFFHLIFGQKKFS